MVASTERGAAYAVRGWDEIHAALEPLVRAASPRLRAALAGRRTALGPHPPPEDESPDWRVAPLPRDVEPVEATWIVPAEARALSRALTSQARSVVVDVAEGLVPRLDALIAAAAAAESWATCPATLAWRPRALDVWDRRIQVDGMPAPAAFLDSALYLVGAGRARQAAGRTPVLDLTDVASAAEARLWAEGITALEAAFGIVPGSVAVVVGVGRVEAAADLDEVLSPLRDRAVGLVFQPRACARAWAVRFAEDPARVLPDPSTLGSGGGFLRAAARRVVETARRRGLSAWADLPGRDPEPLRSSALEAVATGFDGARVACPIGVMVARAVWGAWLPSESVPSGSARDLNRVPSGPRTLAGARRAAGALVRCVGAWLVDAPLRGDLADASLGAAWLWQVARHRLPLAGGKAAGAVLVRALLDEQVDAWAGALAVAPSPEDVRRVRACAERICTTAQVPDGVAGWLHDRLLD